MPTETEEFCSSKLTLLKNTVCVVYIAGQKNFLQALTHGRPDVIVGIATY
jgi:hypothetical protein